MTGGARLSYPRTSRRWITALALLAFFLQNLAVQTHVHPSFQAAVQIQTGNTHKTPIKLDPVDQCRLCQELVHAGAYIGPSGAASPVNLTLVAVSLVAVLAFAADPATAFAWQSRAPPRR